MTALEIFRMIAPEYASMPDIDETSRYGDIVQHGVQSYLDLYSDEVSKLRFGTLYGKALAYYTAHKLKFHGTPVDGSIDSSSASESAVTDTFNLSSFSEGDISVSFSTSQSTNLTVDAELALTKYGMEYLALRRNCIIPIICSAEK